MMMNKVGLVAVLFATFNAIVAKQPYYLEQCPRDENIVDECLRDSGNKLVKYLRQGVPELDIFEVEPVVIDEISIALGSGPDGYRAIFRNIEAFGVSNLTVTNVRSDVDTLQFQLTLEIPMIRVKAKYQSSGVLILVRASGSGDYWGEYGGVRAKLYFKAVPKAKVNGLTYLTLENAKMDFSVRDIRMGVENIANENAVIKAALNLFINSNAQDLLKEMKPSLKTKLVHVIGNFMERLFKKIPLEHWFQ